MKLLDCVKLVQTDVSCFAVELESLDDRSVVWGKEQLILCFGWNNQSPDQS